MPAAAWMTLIVSAVIILITAVALIRVIYHLNTVRTTLAATIG